MADSHSFLLSHHSIRLPSRQLLPLPVLGFQTDSTRPRNNSHLIHRKPEPNPSKLLRIIECPRPPMQPTKTIERSSPERERSQKEGKGKKMKSESREKSQMSEISLKQEMENVLRKMSKVGKRDGETSRDLERSCLNKSTIKTVKELAQYRRKRTKTQITSQTPIPTQKWSDLCTSTPYLLPSSLVLKPKPRRMRLQSRAASRSMHELLAERGEELRGWAQTGLRYQADDEQTPFLQY